MVRPSATAMEMEEDANTVKLADLLHSARPLTATAAASLSSPPSPQPRQRPSDRRVLIPLDRPTTLVGTLTLPSHTTSPACSCFRFSDDSATVCCDLLRFRAAAVGKEIRVTAWNFIPFKHRGSSSNDRGGGFLEIINWRFADPNNEESSLADSLPMSRNRPGLSADNLRAVHGVVESVSPVSVVPCTTAASGYDLNSGPKVNFPGFLVQLLCCECKLCGSRVLMNNLKRGSFSVENNSDHSFTKMEIVYFYGDASSFYPVMTKLIAKRVVVLGLKKKLVYMTKEESCLMYVTVDDSILRVCPVSKKRLPRLKGRIKGKGECGSFTGVVKGVHMQGMALELDHDVWLLLTDQLHTLIHGLRIGSIISVKNVHFVDPKFSWTKIIILGACVKTSITVESFSPLETACNVVMQSTSMLGKFIQSLPFSARLWVLLLVSSLRKMFAGILSDKDILGSVHKEGLAQMYTSSLLPPSVFQTSNGAFLGLCRHDLNGCGRELHCGFLKLVVPMSIFICHCIDSLVRSLKSENYCKLLSVGNHFSILSHEARYDGRSVRRIIPSTDVGIVLLGYLKINPSTRRLQLVDATGGIDVLIPDLPLTWNPNEIYEVTDYDVFFNGIDGLVDQLALLENESLSCRAIFNCTQAETKLSTSIFVYCLWKNAKRREFPLDRCINTKDETEILKPGSYYLLRVSHKFPLQNKCSSNMISNKSSTFVEALLMPCILLISGKSGSSNAHNVSRDRKTELSKYCISGNNEVQVSIKRQKIIKESVNSLKDGFQTSIYGLSACSNSIRESEMNEKSVSLSSSHDISCLVTFRGLQNEKDVCPGILRCTSLMEDMSFNSKSSARKILLEFSAEKFLKYEVLKIGGYYIIEHDRKDCFSNTKDAGFGSSGTAKFLIDSIEHIWSLSFISDEVLFNYNSVSTSAKDSLSPTIDAVLPKDQIEQLLLRFNDNSSDVCLYLPVSHTNLLEDNIMEPEDSQIQQFAVSEERGDTSLSSGTVVARPTFCSGSQSSNCLFPEGNLISLEGNVVDIHDISSGFYNSCSSGTSLEALQMKGLVGVRSSFCIHVLVHHHIVNIFCSISKHSFPTGFGPGVTATFHRILDARVQNKFMLLPVSFIVIKSVNNKQWSDGSSNSRPTSTKDAYNASQDSFSCLISQLPQFSSHKQIVLGCRVGAVFLVVLEWKATNFNAETSINASGNLLDIPLAGFLLDDGSSSCCCWANAERAATLLRLQEQNSSSYHVRRILKKYKRITVKNNGTSIDSPCQDLVVSVTSGGTLCSSDEKLLKLIIFNACVGRTWNVVAGVMDAEEVRQLDKKCPAEMNMQTMQNIWAKEVSCPRPLAEARNMMQELLKS